MGQITVAATLIAAPAQSTDQQFPSGTTTIPFVTTPSPKTYNVDTGRNTAQVNSPSSFVALQGLGANGPVTQAHTVYIRTSVPMNVRLTYQGGSALGPLPIQGVFFLEVPPATPLTLVEIEGSGTVEYYFAGNQ